MIRILQCKCGIDDTRTMEQLAADYLKIPVKEIRQVHIRKRSIDARKKPDVKLVYSLDFSCDEKLPLDEAKRQDYDEIMTDRIDMCREKAAKLEEK